MSKKEDGKRGANRWKNAADKVLQGEHSAIAEVANLATA